MHYNWLWLCGYPSDNIEYEIATEQQLVDKDEAYIYEWSSQNKAVRVSVHQVYGIRTW
jgi:hypothetical protein